MGETDSCFSGESYIALRFLIMVVELARLNKFFACSIFYFDAQIMSPFIGIIFRILAPENLLSTLFNPIQIFLEILL